MIAHIEAYEDDGRYVVAALDEERDEEFLQVYSTRAEALGVATRIAKSNPHAAWEVDL